MVIPEGYKQTEIGVIPEDWDIKTFDETGDYFKGRGISMRDVVPSGLPCIMYGDIYVKFDTHFDRCDFHIKEEVAAKSSRAKYGDLLFTASGETAEEIGKCVAYIGKSDIFIGGDIIALRPYDEYDSLFLSYVQNSKQLIQQKASSAQGHSVVHISTDNIKKTVFACPKKPEQEAITAALSDIDALIDNLEKLIAKKKAIKQACLQDMFPKPGETVPKMRLPGFTGAWEQRKLGEICIEMLAGGDIDKKKLVAKGLYPVLANALTNDGIIGYYENDYRVKAPAVTITGRGDVGHAKARNTDFTPVVRLLAIRTNHDADFIENAINTLKIVVESTGVPQLTVPQLEKYELHLPTTIDEEKNIGKFFVNLDHLITLHQRELEKYKQIKQGMMQQLLTGRIRIKDNNIGG